MTGRGGAGNILRAREQSKTTAEDIETNRSPASSEAPPATSSPLPTNSNQEYAHTGRGGAGNWYQPSELSKTGTFSSPSDTTTLPTADKPQISTPWHPENQEMPLAKAGRGGAGNFIWGSGEGEEEKKKEDEKKVKEEVGKKVEMDVEAGLAKPPGAFLEGAKAGRGW
ncbi:hypothetical protein P280DRAFT_472382 [Massarina eburnea CBS 473.64]|uniref:Uncharacterized protein n=1 Tax=Massarina eburnea CBS 473.64 TaxID=1395130 RepID=A0A6A6RQ24_9PLEO|nr:hypothetical protein P280DRAFT_472382 [Massarina eburnea CBS 473.64]